MALLNIFKKGKKKESKISLRAKAAGHEAKKAQVKTEIFKSSEKPQVEVKKDKKKSRDERVLYNAHKILKRPHVTEKATQLADVNKYIFEVWPKASKAEVKKAVENVYNVTVLSVRMINIPRKKRRIGRSEGWRRGYKKALVRLKEGETIEVLPR